MGGLTESEARFTINVKDGIVELEGKQSFVDVHLERFEEIFKTALREAIMKGMTQSLTNNVISPIPSGTAPEVASQEPNPNKIIHSPKQAGRNGVNVPPIPVDLKANEKKPGLREFYTEKKPLTHYEKAAVFAYYLTKFNKEQEVRLGEILSCYEEVNEKKPSITDIVKNSIRYKGWLECGADKFSCRLTISGENFVKFDLPARPVERQVQASLV